MDKTGQIRELAGWLKGVELKASLFYEKASELTASDPELSTLLRQLSDDERLHHDIMRSVEENAEDSVCLLPAAYVDGDTRLEIEAPFKRLETLLPDISSRSEEVLKEVIELEFSELNGIFLYAAETIKRRFPKEFSKVALNMDQHRDRIRRYISDKPELWGLKGSLDRLPSVKGGEKILIVDDSDLNISLLKAVLNSFGTIDSANNGTEALKKLGSSRFSAVVTDIHMPVMDGLELFSQAVKGDPELTRRFLFFTSSRDLEHISFFRKNNLKYLVKPSPINAIKSMVRDVIG